MNYDQAKALIAEHAPRLIVDPDTGHNHVDVRKAADGAHFSITLPAGDGADKALCDAVDYAMMAIPEPKADVPPGPERAE